MTRYPRPHTLSYSFGPGPMTPAIKWIIWANIGAFVATVFYRDLIYLFGLTPSDVIQRLRLWQPVTYMFLHAGPTHILFNMLGLWMFGVELERMWGTRFFLRYYAVTGIGAAVTTIVVALLPFGATAQTYNTVTVGASGALFGILLAFALYLPERPDPDGVPLSHAGEVFRHHHRCALGTSHPRGCRTCRAPRRGHFRVPVSSRRARRAHRRNQSTAT